jgi:ABC-type multidrug transport system fused ATPase/permease subunit
MESLPDADHILVLRDGTIVQAGKFNELLQNGTDFSTLMGAHNEALENMQLTRNHVKSSTSSPLHDQHTDQNGAIPLEQQVRQQQLVKEEERERGKVSWKVYWAYITDVAGGAFIPIYFVGQIGFQGFQILNSYWMAWGTSEVGSARVSTYHLILVYVLIAVAGTLCILVRAITVSLIGLKTAQNYFLRMLRSIFRAPMSFFDSTPSGRILNRMSADQEQMDLEIHFSMSRVMNALLQLVALFTLMSTVTWEVVLLVVPIAVTCTFLQWYYIASGRELARLTSIRKSPIINHYAESIAGAATIRGFHEEARFMETNLDRLDIYGRAYFHTKCSREWFIIRMEMLSALFFTLFLVLLVTFPRASMNPSLAGVAITYSLSLSSALGRFLWNLSNLEVTVVCAERILQYSELPSEAPLVIKNVHPAHDWPSKGTIAIHNLQVRYNEHSPLVLHGLNCTFYGGERVGIVGRTGSGKSTLILALFRVVEPVGGSIVIDGLDISTIGLHDLRSNLSIIPQDPILFEGSIRVNLDPLGKYSDAEIWEALDKCQLGDIIRAKDDKLEASVSENGENWSVGQRQLVCMGRALLKQTRILVLDEATASVDSATDQLIQHTLRSEFRHCTVVTVAHRIPTIVDSDRVLVLDNGRVVEHDTPQALLQDPSSFFSKIFLEYSL